MVRGAKEKYKTKFYNLHIRNKSKLTMNMIDISFVSFQCYLALGEQPVIDYHMESVHGIQDGVISLKEKVDIEVDSKSPSTLPSLLDIELLGPGKRANLITSVFTNCVARGVFK